MMTPARAEPVERSARAAAARAIRASGMVILRERVGGLTAPPLGVTSRTETVRGSDRKARSSLEVEREEPR
jgi:hypothetical protein